MVHYMESDQVSVKVRLIAPRTCIRSSGSSQAHPDMNVSERIYYGLSRTVTVNDKMNLSQLNPGDRA